MEYSKENGLKAELGEGTRKLRIAICGIRGVPACYGGFETFAEALGTRLVQHGHQIRVYGRTHVIDYQDSKYLGMEIKLLPAPRHKYLETPVHTLLCLLHLIFYRVDVILVCNAANSPFIWISRLTGTPVAVNVDGIERKRAKWNWVGRLWYRLGEITSVLFASRIVADADIISEYYLKTYRAKSDVIRYGYNETLATAVEKKVTKGQFAGDLADKKVFSEIGISPGKYILYVSRLEPENNAHIVIKAYNMLPVELRHYPLVIVGDAPYAAQYIRGLKSLADERPKETVGRVVFAGYRFGEDYPLLQWGAGVYIQATEVGGTHPALVEAMGFGNCILANDTPEHREALGDSGIIYRKNDACDLQNCIARVLSDDLALLDARRAAHKRALTLFTWNKIASDYEKLFINLAS